MGVSDEEAGVKGVCVCVCVHVSQEGAWRGRACESAGKVQGKMMPQ